MERTAEQRHAWIICVVLALATFFLYLPVTRNDFIVYDDPTYVTSNPYVLRGLTTRGVAWAFTSGYASNWHPLTWLSHMLDVQLYGVQNPGAHHLTSVLFHVANTLLLFLALRRLTGALWRSAVVAAFFAWHPLHVESVAWVSERKDVLSTFFGLLTLLAYARYVTEKRAKGPRIKSYYAWILVFFALALLAKPMLVTLPFVLLLLDFWPLGRVAERGVQSVDSGTETTGQNLRRLVLEKIPLFGLTLISSVVTFTAQKNGGAVMDVQNLPLANRLGNAFLAYVGYLKKMFWPVDLAIFYPLPRAIPVFQLIVAVLMLAAISVAAIVLAKRRPYVLVGWLWFLGMLVPVIGLVQVGAQAMADRYSYLSLVGIFIIFVWGLADLLGHGRLNQPSAAWAIILPLLLVCLLLTRRQEPYWKNTETLFRRDLAVVDDNTLAHLSLGLYLDKIGHTEDGLEELTAALRLDPHSATIYNNLGLHFAKEHDLTNAIGCYENSLRYKPSYSDTHYNLANVLVEQGKLSEAAEQYTDALRLEPLSADAHNNLGAVLVRQGKLPEALDQFKEALRIIPDFPEAQDQLGGVLLRLGHPDLAQLHFQAAIRLKPDFAHAHLKLGLALAEQNYLQEALPHFQTAIKLEPTNADAYFNLAADYAALNRLNDAAETFGEAIRRNPDDVQPRVRLAAIQQTEGQTDAAIVNYRGALRVQKDTPEALRGLAWILATSTKPELRDGAEAVRLAERANELTGQKHLPTLSTLDAAYAEAGRFDDAIKIAEQVQTSATAQKLKPIADKAAQRLELYHAGKAFHE
jgi:tetratricopeptide (TPR) repeat protein